jgi:hypothetical protein
MGNAWRLNKNSEESPLPIGILKNTDHKEVIADFETSNDLTTK